MGVNYMKKNIWIGLIMILFLLAISNTTFEDFQRYLAQHTADAFRVSESSFTSFDNTEKYRANIAQAQFDERISRTTRTNLFFLSIYVTRLSKTYVYVGIAKTIIQVPFIGQPTYAERR